MLGNNQGEERDLFYGEIVIGRGQEADFILLDAKVSRQHARIFEEKGKFFIEDLESRNGTVVENRRIKGKYALELDQSITIGRSVVVLTEKESPFQKKRLKSSNQYMLLSDQLNKEHRTQTMAIKIPKEKRSFLEFFKKKK